MLGLVGLLGALFAGIMADTVMRTDDGGEDPDMPDDDLQEPTDNDDTSGLTNLLDSQSEDIGPDPALERAGMPQSDDIPDEADESLNLVGTDAAEDLNGNGADDQIQGGDGADFLGGRAGDDWLSGDAGDDHLHGDEGADSLYGGAGADNLHGEDGADLLDGGEGNDLVAGHEGDDNLQGGAGDDSLTGGNGFDSLLGGEGADVIGGGYGRDLLGGGHGADELDGGEGSDTIWGQAAGEADTEVDFLNGGTGDDLLMLGAGDYGNGGEGSDVFGLLDVLAGDPPIQITDFNPAEDSLVVLYDAGLHPNPQLSIETSENGMATLMLDGVALVSLTNGAVVDLSSISLRAA